jgi:predicted transcriptional regulator
MSLAAPPLRLGSSSSASAEYGFTISKNVTFKVRSRGSVRSRSRPPKHHRRTRSDPLQPLSHTKLLSEEINQLQKKKQKLESGIELNRWNGKERKKLQEAIEKVLEEKRKKQLGKIKRR